MDNKSLEILEFPHIREIIAGFTSFAPGREQALRLQPRTDGEAISRLLQQSAEARQLLTLHPGFSIGGAVDVREMVQMAARGKVLEPPDLIAVQKTLGVFNQIRASLARLAKELPLLWEIAAGITEISDLEREIAHCLSPGGELLDQASPGLHKVRKQLGEIRRRMLDRLQAVMASPRWRKIIQEPIVTERETRYVIPVKAEHRREIKGIVHDVSNTGATVFVEPWLTVDLGNSLRELVMAERREVERILRTLSARVAEYEAPILRNTDLAAELDLTLAKARFALRHRATEPAIAGSSTDGKPRILRLIEARHPLLGEKAVPLTVEMGRDYSILVITGPNTGGKTVALKTIGLLCLMAQAGIPIPASADSHLPIFEGIFADIGDEQSIEQTLSTFSWHMGNIVRFLAQATTHSLVLLDELGTSTDPAEGSALARSVLLHLLSRNVMTVATTHLGDLKAFAHTTPGLQNASLDFDPVTLMPTYHLTVGVPGGSNALAIASRLGLSAEIISEARNLLGEGTREMESLLADLTAEKHQMGALRARLARETEVVQVGKLELENELARARAEAQKALSEERQAIQEVRDRAVREVAELHREIRLAVGELRREKSKEKVEAARQVLSAARKKLSSALPPPIAVAIPPERIAVGDRVWLRETSLPATVLAISEATQEVQLQAGQVKLTVSLDSIEKLARPEGNAAPQPVPVPKLATRTVPMELDLRGKRAEEIEPLLDSYLDDAAVANMSQVRIIHGFGTGTVRQIVREMLSTHPLVKAFRSGERHEGGDGATVVML